ncbi:MAG: WecB/TagA/CpsF family glycosyltransferase [Candidatus Hydrogenedentes bacterium]|nr:WecB/TagA/CpsF family glycosyltransferase [Candidatus Hydrogenedentota bacterium]
MLAPKSDRAPRILPAGDARVGAPAAESPVHSMFGIRFNDVNRDEFFALVDQRVDERYYGYVVTPNVDHICLKERDPDFRAAYESAWLVLVDGTPLLWASRLLGKPLREKLSGSDLVGWLCGHCAKKGHSVFFFGAREGVGAEAAQTLKAGYPALKIAGVYSPPFGFHLDPEKNAEAIRIVRESGADIVFVALGCPKQEVWLQNHGPSCGAPVMLGVGGSFEFVSGRVRRAPVWMQNAGMEWIWRLTQEPRRLWRRYLIEDLLFFRLLGRELMTTYGIRRG